MRKDGINRDWTPERELAAETLLKTLTSFAERHTLMTLRDILKYDSRSKQGKRATAQARLRLSIATDDELRELAQYEARQFSSSGTHQFDDPQRNFVRLVTVRGAARKLVSKKDLSSV